MNKSPILLIFDIDGTLIDTGGLGRLALDRTAEELYGVKEATQGIKPYGMTDYVIFFEIIQRNRIPFDDLHLEFNRFCEHYFQSLGFLLHETNKSKLHRGVQALLEKLKQEKNVFFALGTGNIEQTAYLKLHYHGIASYFLVGGFGSDSYDRPDIIDLAYHRAQKHYRIPFAIRDTWVIGDTPKDIIAGRSIGANTIAVANSIFSQYDLARYQPSALLQDFDDWEHFLDIIHGRVEFVNRVSM